MMSGIGSTIVQGMAFGTGSAMAHRAVDGVMGPRTVEHVHRDEETKTGGAGAPTSFAPGAGAGAGSRLASLCSEEGAAFATCMRDSGNNMAACKFSFDILSRCQLDSSENAKWK